MKKFIMVSSFCRYICDGNLTKKELMNIVKKRINEIIYRLPTFY